jgi:hypothetical protein
MKRASSLHRSLSLQVVFGGSLILVMPFSGLHIDSDQLKNKATPYFAPVAKPESYLSLFPQGIQACYRFKRNEWERNTVPEYRNKIK